MIYHKVMTTEQKSQRRQKVCARKVSVGKRSVTRKVSVGKRSVHESQRRQRSVHAKVSAGKRSVHAKSQRRQKVCTRKVSAGKRSAREKSASAKGQACEKSASANGLYAKSRVEKVCAIGSEALEPATSHCGQQVSAGRIGFQRSRRTSFLNATLSVKRAILHA